MNNRIEDILGVWHLKDFDDNGYSFSQIAYLNGGKKCEISLDFNLNGNHKINYYLNTWKIENGLLISTVEDSKIPHIPKGDVITDVIHKLTPNKLVVLMDSDFTPEIEDHQKISGEDPNLICSIVERNLKIYHSKNIKQEDKRGLSRLFYLSSTHDIAMTYGIGLLVADELPEAHSEIRIWIGFGSEYVEKALILRKTPDEDISGEVLVHFPSYTPDSIRQNIENTCVNFITGNDGTDVCTQKFETEPDWESLYTQLTDEGLYTLPDQSQLPPPEKRVLDGVTVLVELRKGGWYRHYHYNNPQFHDVPEADSALNIINIVKGVFGTDG